MRCRIESTPRAAALPGTALLTMMLALVAIAPASPAQEGSDTIAASTADAAASEAAGEAGVEADDAEWLVDEETGQRYYIEQIPKIEGIYRWVDESTIRYRHGLYFQVVEHDEDWFWVKAFEPEPKTPSQPAATRPREKTEEEKAAELALIATSYETDIATVDRLRLEGFDDGLPQAGQWRNGFDVADMNGDGHLDIVFGPARKASRTKPNIFLGDGRGNWRPWAEARFAPLGYDYGDAAAGDLNGDGHMDLVLGVHLRGILALVGDGEGDFRAWTEGIQFDVPGQGGAATSFSSRALELVDWNDDGRLDILALGEGPKGSQTGQRGEVFGDIINTSRGLVVYLNQGDGTWTPRRPGDEAILSVLFGDGFAFGDFDGDGDGDIVLASRMRNNKQILGIRNAEGLWDPQPLEVLRTRTFVGAVAAADLGGDGRDEVFVGYQTHEQDRKWRTGVDVFSADGSLGWQRRLLFASEGRRGIKSLATGNLDGDGRLDLAAVSGNGEIWVFLGDGEGFFVSEDSPELPPPAEGCGGYALRLRDLDRDGRDEMIVGFAGEETGLPGIPGYHKPGCPGQGSLRAWKAVDAAAPSAAAPSASSGR